MTKVKCISIREAFPNQISVGKYYWIDENNIFKYDNDDNDFYTSVYLDEKKEHSIGILSLSHFDLSNTKINFYKEENL